MTIFEAAAGGLFTSDAGVRAGNFVVIPNQTVDDKGKIAIHYPKLSRRAAPLDPERHYKLAESSRP